MRISSLLGGGVGVVLFLTSACRQPSSAPKPSPVQRNVIIACGAETVGGLVFLAESSGAYQAEGLTAEVRTFPSGRLALESLLRGEAPVAACANTPLAFAGRDVPDLRVLAVIGTSDNETKVVARRDHGIQQPADLRGRKVATQQASTLHAFLHLFLLKYGLLESDVTLSFGTPATLQESLLAGTCDAAAIREPQISPIMASLGTNVIVFSERGLYVKYYLLVTRTAFLEQEPETVRAVVRALLKAEEAAGADPGAAQTALCKKLHITPQAMTKSWPDVKLHVSLPQALLPALENEARWMTEAGLVAGKKLPNFLALIDSSILQQLKPEEVTVIH